MFFPVSGLNVFPLVPFLVAFVISLFTSTGGVSGAFVLLPFQVSILGFSGPAVTPTNHLFNVVAIPSGVYRYVSEGRMVWPLTILIILGTIPGVIVGSLVRIWYLPEAHRFKLFIAFVLLLLGSQLVAKILRSKWQNGIPAPDPGSFHVRTIRFDFRRLEYEFGGSVHCVSTAPLFLLTVVIGVIGGAYGVGGGAIIAPFLVSLFDLPVHTIAGATLMGTCLTSIVGVAFFALAQPLFGIPGVSPDWLLGGLFGLGGFFGMYCGARLQRRIPARLIQVVLATLVLTLAISYTIGYFRG